MPFNDARTFMDKYFDERYKQLKECKRLEWSTDRVEKFEELVKKFDRTQENKEWEGYFSDETADIGQTSNVRVKIAWLAGCCRDVRKQFAADSDDRMRAPMDHMRFHLLLLQWAKKGVQRFKELCDIRQKPLKG